MHFFHQLLYLSQFTLLHYFRVSGVFSTESPSSEPLTSVTDGPETSTTEAEKPTLPRSHSERLLAINKEFVMQEKELREKYHEAIYSTAEKVMRVSQTNQMKALKVKISYFKAVFAEKKFF